MLLDMYIGQHKLLSHMDRLVGLESGVVLPPINVEIDLTNRCNLGCQWCDFAHTHVSGPLSYRRTVETGDVMSTENAATIVRQLGKYGVRSVTWTGGGEPTLHPDFGYVLQMCHESGTDQGIYTNGTNISDSLAKTISRCCRWAYVSLDATTAHRFKTSKKSDLFKNAVEGIKRLVGTGMHVGVGFLIDQHNVGYFADTITLAEELKPTYINYRPAVQWSRRKAIRCQG